MKIIPDEELLTLITCHPYTKNYQRYVVYCRRTGIAETDRGGQQEDPLLAVTGEDYESSRDDILMEKLLNFTALVILAVLAVPMRLRK